MTFPVTLPMKKHRMTLQIWDKDLLSSNDYISEATFDFDAEALRAFNKEEHVDVFLLSIIKWINALSSMVLPKMSISFGFLA